ADTEAQPGALPGGLGGEKGLKDFISDCIRNAVAIVPDGYLNSGAGPAGTHHNCRGIVLRLCAVPLGNGMKSVVDQVEDDAPDILGDYLDRGERFVERGFKFCIEGFVLGPESVIGEPEVLVHEQVDVRGFPVAGTRPAVLQHALYDPVGPSAVMPDFDFIVPDVGGDYF